MTHLKLVKGFNTLCGLYEEHITVSWNYVFPDSLERPRPMPEGYCKKCMDIYEQYYYPTRSPVKDIHIPF